MGFFENVLNKLKVLANIDDKVEKKKLLVAYMGNEPFLICLELMLTGKTFGMKELPKPSKREAQGTFEGAISFLNSLAWRKVKSQMVAQELSDCVGLSSGRDVVNRILGGTTEAGFGLETLRTIDPNLIRSWEENNLL